MSRYKFGLVFFVVVILAVPATAGGTHAGNTRTRSQKYTFSYGSSIPTIWHGAINRGFAAWDVSGQCHDYRLGDQITTNRGTIDGQTTPSNPGVLAIANQYHTVIFIDWGEIWHYGESAPPYDHFDLQSTMTHEAGHMLSLIHTGGADTMAPSQSIGSSSLRSLEWNDIAWIRNLYPYGTCVM